MRKVSLPVKILLFAFIFVLTASCSFIYILYRAYSGYDPIGGLLHAGRASGESSPNRKTGSGAQQTAAASKKSGTAAAGSAANAGRSGGVSSKTPTPAPTTPRPETTAPDMGDMEESLSELFEKGSSISLDKVFSFEGLSLSDKIAGLAIAAKIKKADLEKMYSMSSDGLTTDEISEIYRILNDSLSPKDMERLSEIVRKNVKLYAESQKGE